jgi:hypothetical protein
LEVEPPIETTEAEEEDKLSSGKTFVLLFDSEYNITQVSDIITGNRGKILRTGSKGYNYAILPTLHDYQDEVSLYHFTEQWVVSTTYD